MAAGKLEFDSTIENILVELLDIPKSRGVKDASTVNILRAYQKICRGVPEGIELHIGGIVTSTTPFEVKEIDVTNDVINALRKLGESKIEFLLDIINREVSEVSSTDKFYFGQYLIFDPEIMGRISEDNLAKFIRDRDIWEGINRIIGDAREEEIKHSNVRGLFNKALDMLYNGEKMPLFFYNALAKYMVRNPDVIDGVLERGVWPFITINEKEDYAEEKINGFWRALTGQIEHYKGKSRNVIRFFEEVLLQYFGEVRIPDNVGERKPIKEILHSLFVPVPTAITEIGFSRPEIMKKIIEDNNILTKLATDKGFLYCLEEQVNHINNELSKSDNYNIKSQIERFTEIYNTWLNKFLKKAIDESSSLSEDSQEMVGSLVLKTVALYKHILLEDSKKLLEYAYEKLPKIMAELTLPMIQ